MLMIDLGGTEKKKKRNKQQSLLQDREWGQDIQDIKDSGIQDIEDSS